ncbi:hypothetical protein [Novosphingobium album (ex Liu et al. 2023)]|uniref:Uncharacterized protein n=1 Tax=Novosphingobium album (ex Liu et al. 2023) TaxID=3031130 RepID=A0ABT5WQ42_9SPHN|nr:hypothetical protein [Novosphingobium album (ex Liu et al. 2023)]MDE8652162.1 hypothetical protein [Novosphingobium album (ex Liu et al. 2023)]
MNAALFRDVASAEGWSDATQIAVLLRYIAQQAPAGAFGAFLAGQRADPADEDAGTDTADAFMRAVMILLADPGLKRNAAFRSHCRHAQGLLTPRDAAERWCRWSLG